MISISLYSLARSPPPPPITHSRMLCRRGNLLSVVTFMGAPNLISFSSVCRMLHPQCHQFSIGEKVWVRDEDDAEWEAGVVGAVTADGRPRYRKNTSLITRLYLHLQSSIQILALTFQLFVRATTIALCRDFSPCTRSFPECLISLLGSLFSLHLITFSLVPGRVQRNSGTAAFPFNECRRRREGGRRPSSDSAFLKRLDSDSSDSSDSSSDSTESTSGRSDVSSLGGGAGGDLAAAGGGAATTEASPHRASMRRRNGEPDEPPPPVDRSPALSPTNRRKRDDER